MEVSPEIYAWMCSLNIIDPLSDRNPNKAKTDSLSNYIIPEDLLECLFKGEYIDTMILDLQEAYNKYFDNKKDCSIKLNELIFKEGNYEKISDKTKLENWKIIKEALKYFDIYYSYNELNKIVNGNKTILLKVITNIFNISSQYLKYTKLDTKNDNKTLTKKNKIGLNLNMNFPNNITNSNSKEKLKKNNSNSLLNISQNSQNNSKNLFTNNYLDVLTTNNNDNNSENNYSINNIFNNKIKNTDNNIDEFTDDSIDLDKIYPNTLYEKCTSPLEFYVVSLCKNLKIKPVQAVGLLSNNRHYLSVLCSNGVKNDYSPVKKWLEDLQVNFDILIKLIDKFKNDGVYMSYCIFGTALCSKDLDISVYGVDLINSLFKKYYINKDWLIKYGINSFIFTFIKHKNKAVFFLDNFIELIKKEPKIFFNEIKQRIANDDEYKILIYDLFYDIIDILNKLNNGIFKKIIYEFILNDLCLHEEKKLTYSCSLLCKIFSVYYKIIDDNLVNKIVLYFKKCIRSNLECIYATTITKIFILIKSLSKPYNKNAPILYKILVNLFIDLFDVIQKREVFLKNFMDFFHCLQQVPVDIFFNPYLKELKEKKNYNLCDFSFLNKIVLHPRIELADLRDIINFLIEVNLENNNNYYKRCAILVFENIMSNRLPFIKMNEEQNEDFTNLFMKYINNSIDTFMNKMNNYKITDNSKDISNIKDNENKVTVDEMFGINNNINDGVENNNQSLEEILEMSYIIMKYKFGNVNLYVQQKIVICCKRYYKGYKKHSGILLGMLKNYQDFGNILFEIEQNI